MANWLDAVLQDVTDGNTDINTLWELLEVVKEFVVQTGVSKALAGDEHVADADAW